MRDRCWCEAGLTEAGDAAYDDLRLGLGVPDGSRDLVLEKSVLLEAGFDELNGVDWNKGCYIGQELTARTKYRGLIKRRLVPVMIVGPAPPPGTIVTADGRDVGEMRSSRDRHGLAVLRIETLLGDKPLMAGEAVVVPATPGWMRFPDGRDSRPFLAANYCDRHVQLCRISRCLTPARPPNVSSRVAFDSLKFLLINRTRHSAADRPDSLAQVIGIPGRLASAQLCSRRSGRCIGALHSLLAGIAHGARVLAVGACDC